MKKIDRYIANKSFEIFASEDLIVDAVVRNLEIIGEAARNISDDIKESNQDIPWKRMIGLRNITIHEYFGIDLNIIWEIISKNLPETRPQIEEMLGAIDSGTRNQKE